MRDRILIKYPAQDHHKGWKIIIIIVIINIFITLTKISLSAPHKDKGDPTRMSAISFPGNYRQMYIEHRQRTLSIMIMIMIIKIIMNNMLLFQKSNSNEVFGRSPTHNQTKQEYQMPNIIVIICIISIIVIIIIIIITDIITDMTILMMCEEPGRRNSLRQ